MVPARTTLRNAVRRLVHDCAMLALALGVAAAAYAQSASSSDPSSRIRPGDTVRITVWRQPELTGEFTVTSDGYIAHPLYREVRVVGVPLATVEAQLTEFLRRYVENPRFVIEPLMQVTVSGAVNEPNVFTVPPGTTVVEMIARAGGATDMGRLDRVRVIRDGREHQVNLEDVSAGRLAVQSRDEVYVETKRQWFRSVIVPAATITGAIASLVIAIRRED